MVSSKERDYYFDNVKFILILLVVIGHVIEPLINTNVNQKALYILIYSFHMPLFVLVSGYFSKKINTDNYILKTIKKVLVPYLIFQVLYFLFFRFGLNNPGTKFSLTIPYWIMWFMLSTFIWKLILPYFVKLKYPIVISIALAVIAGYINEIGYFMSISRTITFFPYFLMGYYLKRTDIEKLNTIKTKILSIMILFCTSIIIYFLAPKIYCGWLYGSYSYAKLNAHYWYAGIHRLEMLSLAILLSISVLSLIPNRKTIFSEMGARTMYVYLLHGFIVKFFVKLNLYSSYDITLLIFAGVLICLILSSRFVEILAKPIIQPEFSFSKKSNTIISQEGKGTEI